MDFGTIFWTILLSNVPYVIFLYHLMLEKKELTIKNVFFPWPKRRFIQFSGIFFYFFIFLFLFYSPEGMYSSPKDRLAIYVSFPAIFITPVWIMRRFVKKNNQWIFITPVEPTKPSKYLLGYIIMATIVLKILYK